MEFLQGPLSDFYSRHPVTATVLFALVCTVLGGICWYLLMFYPSMKAVPFKIRHHTSMIFGYPGPLVYVYDSKIGKRIAPVGLAISFEIINNRPTSAKVHDYVLDVKVNDKWTRLPNLGALNPTDFFWAGDKPGDAYRLDMSDYGFDFQARQRQLVPGEGVKGWMFFEWPARLRASLPHFTHIRIQVENGHGERQTEIIDTGRTPDEGSSPLAGDAWRVLPQERRADLRSIPILPFTDLKRGFKEGTIK